MKKILKVICWGYLVECVYKISFSQFITGYLSTLTWLGFILLMMSVFGLMYLYEE